MPGSDERTQARETEGRRVTPVWIGDAAITALAEVLGVTEEYVTSRLAHENEREEDPWPSDQTSSSA